MLEVLDAPSHAATVADLYERLTAVRQSYLDRARDASRLTVPSVMPDQDFSGVDDFVAPYSGLGARGVNSLASSLLLALLPPNSPFFRLQISATVRQSIEGVQEVMSELEASLSLYEQEIVAEIERRNYRAKLWGGLRQLLITGSVLLFFDPRGELRVYRLDSYVQRLYPDGKPKDVIIKEHIAAAKVPEEVRLTAPPDNEERQTYELYTHLEWDINGNCLMKQWVAGVLLKEQSWSKDRCPFMPQMWNLEPGEQYGRSFAEDFLGELDTLDSLTKSVTDGAAASAKVLVLVDPAGVTRIKDVEAPNLSVRAGRAADISTLQINKLADFSVAANLISGITDRLSAVFLMPEGVIRKSERTTATEVRMMQEQLDRALGGNYSTLATNIQLPIVKLVLLQMVANKALPDLPEGVVEPVVVTGVQALGRSMDNAKLEAFVRDAMQMFGPEALQWLNMGEWWTRKAAALGIDREKLIKTEEQMAQERAAAQQEAFQAEAMSAGVGAVSQVATQQP